MKITDEMKRAVLAENGRKGGKKNSKSFLRRISAMGVEARRRNKELSTRKK